MNKNHPCAIILESQCSNRCIFCQSNNVFTRTQEEMRFEFENNKANIIQLAENGFSYIEISGRDPIESPYLISTIEVLKQNNFNDAQLTTHGMHFSDINYANIIVNSGITILKIPLYGVTEEIHDSITQNKGSFKKTIEGIKNARLSNKNLKIKINTLILKQNKHQFIDIYNLSMGLGANQFIVDTVKLIGDSTIWGLNFQELKTTFALFSQNLTRLKNTRFIDYPFCLFGFYSPIIENKNNVPTFGNKYSVPEIYKTEKHGHPAYRNKSFVDICFKCKVKSKCDGFLDSYLNMQNNHIEKLIPVDRKLTLKTS